MKSLLTLALVGLFFVAGAPALAVAGPVTIRVAPPAPKVTDRERQAELAGRRARVAAKMKPNSLLILWSAEPRNYAGDVDFMYRQENNHFYLTNLKLGGSTFLMVKDGETIREYLFLPKRDPQAETWNGRMYSGEDATRISGVTTIVDSSEQTAFFTALGKKESFTAKGGVSIPATAETVYLLLPASDKDSNGLSEFGREKGFAAQLAAYKVENARPIFGELRQIKSPLEIKLLQHAIDITTEAQMRSMAMVGTAKAEYEVQAEVEYTFRRRNADYWGYPSIVGCGPNATTLHYVESQSDIKRGDLLLMDVGAEYQHYTADVTRTFPVNGKFSKEQREIYQIVYDAQEAVAKATRPGATMQQLNEIANNVVRDGLFKLGLVTDPKSQQHRMWFMHGLGHWLGMNVHDVSVPGPMKAGMVFTNEPGIYIREDALDYMPDTPEAKAFVAKVRPAFEKYKNIGVRIEDDMLVTANGVEWMTKALPRRMDEIEAFMAKVPKPMAYRSDAPANAVDLIYAQIGTRASFSLFSDDLFANGTTTRRGFRPAGLYSGHSHAHSSE